MNVLIMILIVLAGYHLVWESVIIPNLRLRLKYKLSSLQDELWRIKITDGKKIDDEAFDISNEAFINSIDHVNDTTIFSVLMFHKEVKRDRVLKNAIDNRRQKIDNCTDERIKQLNFEGLKCSFETLLINSSGWIIYLFPILLVAICMAIFELKLKRNVRELTLSPRREEKELAKGHPHSLAY
jgi:hypothetical protein